jgi:hypothetical protein
MYERIPFPRGNTTVVFHLWCSKESLVSAAVLQSCTSDLQIVELPALQRRHTSIDIVWIRVGT